MASGDPCYERGWQRFGFDTLAFARARVHGGSAEADLSIAFERGVGKPLVAYAVIPPGTHGPAFGMHVHRNEAAGRDAEEWHVIISGTGIERFTNGDSVAFGPGDLIAVYPGTGHSVEVTGEEPVRMLGILPEMFEIADPDHEPWPDLWQPRIRVLTTTPNLNPLTAECTGCGAVWERPEDDPASGTLPAWAAEHACGASATS
jgi:mannose-6-phosphate isomerase-like protein (cupin superfamily)